jgi:SAM-dependent methyltransferase
MEADMRTTSISQFDLNRAVYSAPGVSEHYRHSLLDKVEAVALLRYQPSFAGRSVLDLGVGTGRTIDFLRPLASHYVCLDYSQEMVDFVRSTRPAVEVHFADMRDLSVWAARTFDFVFGTNNVLDALSHDDRLKTLREVRRVLSSNGIFMFSAHNRRHRDAQQGPRLEYSRNPVTQILNVARYMRRQVNHRRLSQMRRFERDYALLDDIGHDYSLLHYYIDRDAQIRQLQDAGFQFLEVFDTAGRTLEPESDDSLSPTLMYVARLSS